MHRFSPDFLRDPQVDPRCPPVDAQVSHSREPTQTAVTLTSREAAGTLADVLCARRPQIIIIR